VRRTAVVAAAVALALVPGVANARAPRPAPKPAVTITASQWCGAGGTDQVDVTLSATVASDYDVTYSGDNGVENYAATVTLAAGQSTAFRFFPSWPQQLDIVVYDDVTGRTVASRSVAAPSACSRPW
jgi:hypothetical protein